MIQDERGLIVFFFLIGTLSNQLRQRIRSTQNRKCHSAAVIRNYKTVTALEK